MDKPEPMEIAEPLRGLLAEMRPHLGRALRRATDEQLLLLAAWDARVAFERAVDLAALKPKAAKVALGETAESLHMFGETDG